MPLTPTRLDFSTTRPIAVIIAPAGQRAMNRVEKLRLQSLLHSGFPHGRALLVEKL
jgi:hypothetical protein